MHNSRNKHLIINAPDYKLGENFEETLDKLGKKAEKLGIKLGKNRIQILQLIYRNPSVSIVDMADQIGISTTAIEKNLKQMRDVFIKHVGPAKGGHWEIVAE